MQALAQYLFVQINGFKFLTLLAQIFPQVEMLEMCGFFYKLRVPRHNKTIGFLFGKIQDCKDAMHINEYGIEQTSLEQIFAAFALETIDKMAAFTFKINCVTEHLELVNPDRKLTVQQRKRSLVGLKKSQ